MYFKLKLVKKSVNEKMDRLQIYNLVVVVVVVENPFQEFSLRFALSI